MYVYGYIFWAPLALNEEHDTRFARVIPAGPGERKRLFVKTGVFCIFCSRFWYFGLWQLNNYETPPCRPRDTGVPQHPGNQRSEVHERYIL